MTNDKVNLAHLFHRLHGIRSFVYLVFDLYIERMKLNMIFVLEFMAK